MAIAKTPKVRKNPNTQISTKAITQVYFRR